MKNFIKKIIKFIKQPEENFPNFYIFAYHVLNFFQKSLIRLKIIKNSTLPQGDMFNWSFYHLHYKGELKQGLKSRQVNTNLKPSDYQFTNNKLIQVNKNITPLYFGQHLLYETILQLNPESIFELGCGNGIHLYNLNVLIPRAKLFGVDLLSKQIEFLHQSYPNLPALIKQFDATIHFPENLLPKADLSFTQAVIMHIHTDKKHLTALANLFNLSNKYVVLVEKWRNHQFMDDIKYLFDNGLINWNNLYFYYRNLAETNQPFLIVCSNQLLNYPILTNYKILL